MVRILTKHTTYDSDEPAAQYPTGAADALASGAKSA